MKRVPQTQSATSLPRAPQDEARARFRKYAITMSVRMVCFILMVLITPYGWYTWVLAAGAVFLPYFAVVIANVGQESKEPRAVSPERVISPHEPPTPADSTPPEVVTIHETARPSKAGPTE